MPDQVRKLVIQLLQEVCPATRNTNAPVLCKGVERLADGANKVTEVAVFVVFVAFDKGGDKVFVGHWCCGLQAQKQQRGLGSIQRHLANRSPLGAPHPATTPRTRHEVSPGPTPEGCTPE